MPFRHQDICSDWDDLRPDHICQEWLAQWNETHFVFVLNHLTLTENADSDAHPPCLAPAGVWKLADCQQTRAIFRWVCITLAICRDWNHSFLETRHNHFRHIKNTHGDPDLYLILKGELWISSVITVRCHYNAVHFNTILHSSLLWLKQNSNHSICRKQPIPHPKRWGMGCLLWRFKRKLIML